MAGGFLQAADDMVRLAANGMTFGAADRIAASMGEQDTAAKTAAAADRAGFAGDVAEVLGIGGGLKAAWGVGKAGLKVAPKLVRAAASGKGMAALGIGLGSLASYNERTGSAAGPTAMKEAAQPSKQMAKGAGKSGAKSADDFAGDILKAIHDVDNSPPTFRDMAAQLAASQGGKISMTQMGALADIANKTATKPAKQPNGSDVLKGKLMNYYDGLHEAETKQLGPAQADANWAKRYEDLASVDPFAAYMRPPEDGGQ